MHSLLLGSSIRMSLGTKNNIRLEGLPDSMQDNLHVLESVCISIRDVVTKLATRSFAWRLLHQDKMQREIKATEAKLLDAITVFKISAQADNSRLKREITDSIAAAAAKDQSELVAYLEHISQNDHKILHSLQEHHVRMEELLVALMNVILAMTSDSILKLFSMYVQDISSSASGPSEKFIQRAVGAIQRLTEPVAKVPAWQVTSLEVTFDRDNLESLVGKGSFGTVFKGHWGSEVVAVKEMYIEDARIIDRSFKTVRNEIAIWSRLTHPRIVQFYGACLEATQPFLVSRFCSNGNALDYLRTNPQKNRLKLLHQVSEGMTYLHSQSVIHADLKGANILIDVDGKALISDFGVSQLQEQARTSSLNHTGMEKARGTCRWMAPELLEGEKLSFEADIYAFGITAWELYTLEVPFSKIPDRALYRRVIDKQERPECPPTMAYRLVSLVNQCWAPEATKRPVFKMVSLAISMIMAKGEREQSLRTARVRVDKKKQKTEQGELGCVDWLERARIWDSKEEEDLKDYDGERNPRITWLTRHREFVSTSSLDRKN